MGKKFSALSLGILSAAIVFMAVAVFAWSEPGSTPPINNVTAPINIGSGAQTKAGDLNVSGNMGIGTSSPGYKLDVNGSMMVGTSGLSRMGFVSTSGDTYNPLTGASDRDHFHFIFSNPSGKYPLIESSSDFWLMGSSNLRVDGIASVGTKLGVATGNPATRLQVGDSGDGWTNGLTLYSSYPTIYFRDSDNRSSMIHVNGNLMYFLRGCDNASDPYSGNSWCAYNGRWPLYMNMENNDAVFGGNVYGLAFYYNSDARLKKDIAPISDGLQKVEDLNGVYFKWRDSGEDSIGLIAQDVEKVFPEAVATDDKTGLKSVDYSKLVAPLIEAVKSQQDEIEVLNSRIGELESKIELMSK